MLESVERALQNIDQFRAVSKDIRHGVSGGAFTVIAYLVVLALLVCELNAFLKTSYTTTVVVDKNQDKVVRLNFDILMYDLPCKYLKLMVYDKFNEEELKSTNRVKYITVDRDQNAQGKPYTADEIARLEKMDTVTDVTEEELKELDSDWSSSDDHFHHNDFQRAVTFHDFTMVNFFAEWCVHCRRFAPVWMEAAGKLSGTQFVDAEGKSGTIKFMRINCVAFGAACQQAQVHAFPSMRLYKRDGSFELYKGKRTAENIEAFLKAQIGASRGQMLMSQQHHSMFNEGCQVIGKLDVPRVPGHFYLQAEAHGSQTVNPALTNVSHKVNRLHFGDRDPGLLKVQDPPVPGLPELPKEMVSLLTPLDGRSFIAERFHEAPQHNLKVVSMHLARTDRSGRDRGRWYQMTHNDRVRRLRKHGMEKAPQARFTYDFSPMSVVVAKKSRAWYEFLTSLMALLGGTYTIVQLCSEGVVSAHKAVKEALGKAN